LPNLKQLFYLTSPTVSQANLTSTKTLNV